MNKNRITFVINNNSYSLDATDASAIRKIPEQDRRELISLLEAVKLEDANALARTQQADARAKALLDGTGKNSAPTNNSTQQSPSPERLGRGDADALMARLAMEEKINRKPGLTKQGLYKFVIALFVAIILLVAIF